MSVQVYAMPQRNTIEVIINATDNASDVLRGIGVNAQEIGKVVVGAFAGVATGITAAMGAAVTKGLAEFQTFEAGMNEIFTLMPNVTQEAMDSMSADIQAFSARMGVLSEDAIPAVYQALSAGVPQDNVFEFLEVAQKAALGGVTDLETAVDGITSVINAYGTETMSATEASDLMFRAVVLGKCVVGSTRVLLSDGRYKRIDELQDGGEVIAYDGRNFVPMPAKWVNQGIKPTVTLRTRLGREIVTTWNHPYLSVPKEQSRKSTIAPTWRKVSDLKVGDKIAVPTDLPYFGKVDVAEHQAGLLGLWLAEGSGQAASPRITTSLYHDQLVEWCEKWGLSVKNVEKRPDKTPQYSLTHGYNKPNPLLEWLRELGLDGCMSGDKHIPDVVFTWNRRSVATLLHWLFNGDGWLADLREKDRSGFQLGFCSKSERLVRDISHLLLRFGIVGRVRFRKESNAWVWEINRYAEIKRFVDFIGIDRPTTALIDSHAPMVQHAMWGVVEYDPIVEIIAGKEQQVYDLCVEELHNFVANDIVAHNTTFEELSASLFNVAPVAASMGIEFENITAAIAALTAQGVPTSVATTQLRAAFTELADSGSDVGKAFTEVAGQSFRDFMASGGDLADALDLVSQAAEATGKPIDELFGSVEAAQAVLGLTGANADTFRAFLDDMANSAGATDAAFQQMNQGIGRAFARLAAVTQNFFVNLGALAAPMIQPIIKGFSDVIQILANVLGGQFGIEALQDALMEVPAAFRPILRILMPLAAGFRQLATDLDPNNPNGFFGALNAGVPLFGVLITEIRRVMSAMGFSTEVIDSVANAFITLRNTASQVAKFINKLLAPVIEWVKQNIELKDVLIALGIAISSFVIASIIGLAAAFAPLIATFAVLVAGVALLRKAWENNFMGIRDVVQRFQDAWQDAMNVFAFSKGLGTDTFEAIQAAIVTFANAFGINLRPVFDLINKIMDAWQNALNVFAFSKGLGVDTFEALQQAVVAFARTFGVNLQPIFDALNSLIDFVSNLVSAFQEGGLAGVGQFLFDSLKTGIDAINWTAIGTVLWDALEVAVTTAVTMATWVYDNVILPLFNAAKEQFIAIDWGAVGQSLMDGLGTALSTLGTWATWIMDNVLSPLMSNIGTAVSSVDWMEVGTTILTAIGTAISLYGQYVAWIFDNILMPIVNFAGEAIESVDWFSVGAGIVNAIGFALTATFDFIAWIINSIFVPTVESGEGAAEQTEWGPLGTAILNGIGTFLRGAFDFVMWLFTNVLTPLVLGAADAIAQTDWSAVGTGIMDAIGNALGNIAEWVNTHIIQPISDALGAFDPMAMIGMGNEVSVSPAAGFGVTPSGGIFASGGSATSATGGMQTIQGFQFGGHVAAGVPINVGEAGPERFIPSTDGNIMNAQDTEAARGANQPISIQFVFQRSISDNEARESASKLKRELQAQGINVEGTF